MTCSVKLSPHAARSYQKLDPSIRPRVQAAIDALQHHLPTGQIKRLKGRLHDYYRLRVGDYRVLYTVNRSEHLVWVDYIQHRKDVYRHLK